MNFLQRNLFIKLRSENFGTDEELEPMTTFKMQKIAKMMKNLSDIPEGEVRMNNSFLNRRLTKIQDDERHAIDTSIETVYLLRIIVGNVNSILKNGINLKGIIQLGNYLRTKGDKVDFVKLEKWLAKLRIQRIAQLEGSVLITFFDFEQRIAELFGIESALGFYVYHRQQVLISRTALSLEILQLCLLWNLGTVEVIGPNLESVSVSQVDVFLILGIYVGSAFCSFQIDISHLRVITYSFPKDVSLVMAEVNTMNMTAGIFTLHLSVKPKGKYYGNNCYDTSFHNCKDTKNV